MDPMDLHEPAVSAPVDVAEAWLQVGTRLRAFVSHRVPVEDVDDLVQSVMLKLIEHRQDIGSDSVRAWLFAVTRNAVADHYRQKQPSVDLESFADVPSTESRDAAERTIGALTDCLDPMLAALAAADAEVLRKVDIDGVPQTELAASLGVPLSTLKSRVQRARARLRATFDACCAIELGRGGSPIAFERGAACAPGPCASDEPGPTSGCDD